MESSLNLLQMVICIMPANENLSMFCSLMKKKGGGEQTLIKNFC